ncbi:MAG: GxxExxY protein [Flavobacterium sp.]
MIENDISFKIRGAIFKVYNTLGPGLLESVYEIALAHVLTEMGLNVKRQVELPVIFDGVKLDSGFRIDLLVDDLVIVELKSVEDLRSVHHKQLTTYLKLSNLKLGILVNFNTSNILQSIFRNVNGL